MIRTDDMISAGTMTHRAGGSAHDTADLVTDKQIDRLHTEAGNVGDEARWVACASALSMVTVMPAANARGSLLPPRR